MAGDDYPVPVFLGGVRFPSCFFLGVVRMSKITLQMIFDLAWNHFIVGDGKPAVSVRSYTSEGEPLGSCSYLDEAGNKCAVGLALPEGHAVQHFQGVFSDLVLEAPELFADDVLDMGPSDLDSFQMALHDNLVCLKGPGIGGWDSTEEARENSYRNTAKFYGLTIPGENQCSQAAVQE